VVEAVQGASIIVFVMPHQFVPNAVRALQGKVSSTVKAISLVKGTCPPAWGNQRL